MTGTETPPVTRALDPAPVALPSLDFDHETASRMVILQNHPNAVPELKARIARIKKEIDDVDVDNARVNQSMAIKHFAERVAVKLNAIAHLEQRLARLDPGFIPPKRDTARVVLGKIRLVPRWADSFVLAGELNQMRQQVETALTAAKQDYSDLVGGSVPKAGAPNLTNLLSEPMDEMERRVESVHARCQALSSLLDVLTVPDPESQLVVCAGELMKPSPARKCPQCGK